MKPGIVQLIEKLQSGWAPDARQIYVPQQDVLHWGFWQNARAQCVFIHGEDIDGGLIIAEVLWIDRNLEWCVSPEGFRWLYDNEESQKVRYLGG